MLNIRDGREETMRRIEISRVESDTCSCNVCFARNYEQKGRRSIVGEYTPDIFDVRLGAMYVHLCRGCLETLGLAATDVATGMLDHYDGCGMLTALDKATAK